MDLVNRAKNGNGNGIGLNSDPLLIIKLQDSRVLRIMSRSFFLAIIVIALPSIGALICGSSNASYESDHLAAFEMLPAIFSDLFDEGLVGKGHKGGIIVASSTMDGTKKDGIDLAVESNLNVLPDEAFDRVLKSNRIVITHINNEAEVLLQQQPNYRIVYPRRLQKTVLAMRKTSLKDSLALAGSTEKAKPCGMTKEARKVALKGLEDALLEPPRDLRNGYRAIKFLPDLVGDSLATYRRRIFISDERDGGVEEWFYKNYPTKNQHFEVYQWNMNAHGSQTPSIGISNWLRNNVEKEEDFVVMKAEAGVVEEMMKDGIICLVDELFLECKNQWEDEAEERRSKRAYWQCLALYGNLRDQGIAVHQWWS